MMSLESFPKRRQVYYGTDMLREIIPHFAHKVIAVSLILLSTETTLRLAYNYTSDNKLSCAFTIPGEANVKQKYQF